jgi:hypothetical protein
MILVFYCYLFIFTSFVVVEMEHSALRMLRQVLYQSGTLPDSSSLKGQRNKLRLLKYNNLHVFQMLIFNFKCIDAKT